MEVMEDVLAVDGEVAGDQFHGWTKGEIGAAFSSLLKRAAGLAKASGEPNRNKVGKVTLAQAQEIAKQAMSDPAAAIARWEAAQAQQPAPAAGVNPAAAVTAPRFCDQPLANRRTAS